MKNIENFDENQLTFRFSRKNRPIFKTFCQSNAKIMRNLEKKKLTSEKKITKIIVRLTRGRKKGRKKLKQTRKILKSNFFKEKFWELPRILQPKQLTRLLLCFYVTILSNFKHNKQFFKGKKKNFWEFSKDFIEIFTQIFKFFHSIFEEKLLIL